MKKSCNWCGRIHDSKFDCGRQPQKKYKSSPNQKDRFRWTSVWQVKRDEIKERDHFICQICVRGLYEPSRRYETDNLEVHHAEPLEKAWDKRLDNNNLLSLCSRHHSMAEKGVIPYGIIKKIIEEQEKSY